MSKQLFVLLLLAATAAWPQGRTLFRAPAVSKTQIVFAYAGDLWSAPRAGGEATRLTSAPGTETSPVFSPDGTMVAFTGQYDGNTDVYVVPATGGVPKRLTFHPGPDLVHSWTPDGKRVVFTNPFSSHNNVPKLFTVDMNGSFPQEVALPTATMGAFSPDGKQIVYSPVLRANAVWKNYRGGRATPLWIANLADASIVKIPRTDSNDHSPMWIGSKIFFISDRAGRDTLYEYDTATKKVAQLLENKTLDIKAATAGGDAIAFEQFGEIHLYDLKTKKSAKVNITLNADLVNVRPRLEKTARMLRNFKISPTGARALVEARGDIYTIPAEKGDVRNLTNSSGVADRDPAWSPDGKWIAYFSDESGEYQLHLRDQTGRGEVKKIAISDKPTFFYDINWSPDSKKVAFCDKKGGLWYIDLEKQQPVKVEQAVHYGGWNLFDPRWSPDNKWIAYARQLKSGMAAVFVYSVETGKSTQITDGMSDAGNPTWDKGGKYLYFTASTNSGAGTLGLDQSRLTRTVTSTIYAAVLSKDDPSPFAPESDEEKVAEEKKEGDAPKADAPKPDAPKPGGVKPGAGAGAAAAAAKVDVKIDFDNLDQRILPLPMPARNYGNLKAGKAGILFLTETSSAPMGGGFSPPILHKYDMSKRKSEVFQVGVGGFEVSFNGEKILMAMMGGGPGGPGGPGGGEPRMVMAGTMMPPKPGEGMLRLDGLETFVDPVAEWRQMYKEAWRLQRDFFYDPKHHGLDIQAANERYELYLKSLGHRSDLTYLFQEMLGQMSVGHLYIQGGDTGEQPKYVRGGMLGADYALENGRYRFKRVYSGESWNPQTRAPLTQPGVNVKAGDYLIAVNGRNITDADNVYQAFEATAGKAVTMKVGANPNGDGAREVTVVPLDDETALRTLAWVEDNRRTVDKLSEGKLAYVHLPDTAVGGFTYFNRYYFAQTDKQGAVIDERFNRGGFAADYVIDHLRRPVWNYWSPREGEVYTTPGTIIVGPKVMLANENSGSGGDLLPWLFKRAKLGPVVGKRTWGGLVGIGGYPTLIDGGSVTAPHFGFFSPESKWEVENHGTDPDVEIDLDPKLWREGRDSQLEKGVELAMAELKKNPPMTPKKPEFPDYHKGTSLSNSRGTTPSAGTPAGGTNR